MHTAGVPRTYSREEADEILRRALEQQPDGGIHHDDLMAAMWLMAESDLALWAYQDGQWEVLGELAGIDLDANLIWGRAQNPRYFAVGPATDNFSLLPVHPVPLAATPVVSPEPGSIMTLAAVAAGMLIRRRRR